MLNNILSNGMPEAITVNGIPFELNTDYRTWLQIGYLLDELKYTKDYNKILIDICDLAIAEYPEKGYVLGDDLIAGIVEFYKGFPEVDNETNAKRKEIERKSDKKKPPFFDFVYDAKYIYCSFVSFYGIRLQTLDYMHWWEFLTLFEGLMMSDQTSVNFVVGARQQKINRKMPREERARIQRLQKQFALPVDEHVKTANSNLANILGKKSKKNPVEPRTA